MTSTFTLTRKTVKTANDLPFMVAETPVGKTVEVSVLRNGKEMSLKVRIEELTEQRLAVQPQAPAQTYGMRVENITPQLRLKLGISDKTGVVVANVEPGSIADQTGIQAGDIIKEANHRPVRNLADFQASVSKAGQGQPILLLLKRGKQAFYVILESSE